jgi:hypothetical protein
MLVKFPYACSLILIMQTVPASVVDDCDEGKFCLYNDEFSNGYCCLPESQSPNCLN